VIDFQIDRSFPTEGCEFYVTLRRGRVGYATEQDLQTRRLELLRRTFEEVRDQIELLADGSVAQSAVAPSPALGAAAAGRSALARAQLLRIV
jgi:hypothetical protein